MKDASLSGADETNGRPYSSMLKSDLKALAISAIRKHRRLLAADQAVYDEWAHASDDPSISGSVLQALQNEYIARQKKSEIQHEELSEILDALGYVPDVPFESDE
ncbi:transcriptional repressor TraM 1 (plasmid) [Rhizobium etli bv. mimosae str. IE4771]|uniref:Transcriptional repressor TraM 1 n=1 Tax=Rhizobium etli bv. mimosae str. IE4771 TaxID=1432050 RepID=A0A060I3K0_RHIET|nr:transcriptional repressor TraM [Rhizobium sp. IE4771]AIC29718.1 transcriptional repressor TraM 1 [Rhizobium sp. IE4771]